MFEIETNSKICSSYEDKDIYNADETAFYYKALPGKSLCPKGHRLTGGRPKKDRLSALFIVNMDGSDKRRAICVGKSVNPVCITLRRQRTRIALPVDYYGNGSGWMTRKTFGEILQKWNRQLVREGRKVVLLLDNHVSHQKQKCSNIRIEFFPPNCTSLVQPLDQGIIRMVKCATRKLLVSRYLTRLGQGVPPMAILKEINLRRAMEHLAEVKISFSNCFRFSSWPP